MSANGGGAVMGNESALPQPASTLAECEPQPLTKKQRKLLQRSEWRQKRKQISKRKIAPALKWCQSDNVTIVEFLGVARIAPYPTTFVSNCKHRWIGRRVVDVLASEFNAYTLRYFEDSAKDGRLLVNGERFPLAYCFKAQDSLLHLAHRHEPPVRTLYPEHIVHRCTDRLVINKPSSIPVHPSGRYQYNSVVHILARKFGIDYAHPVHRLDRLTSGVLVLALNPDSARSITSSIESRKMAKFYLARVLGEFPLFCSSMDRFDLDVPEVVLAIGDNISASRWIVSDQPIACLSKKFSVFGVSAENGKLCRTAFRRVSYNGRTSVVLCYPITGRTHQIRVHLQDFGYPIANDPCYGGKLCQGNVTLQTGVAADEEHARLLEQFEQSVSDNKVADCPDCSNQQYVPADPVSQGGLFCSEIWLHALLYSCDDWSFPVPAPVWASPGFDDGSYLLDVPFSSLRAF